MKKIVKIIVLFVCIFSLNFLFNSKKNDIKIMAEDIGLPDCSISKPDITSVITNWTDLTKVSFLYEAPEGYIDTTKVINDKVKVYKSNVSETEIALVYEGKICLSDDELPNKYVYNADNALVTHGLFYYCSKLESIDFTNFDTSKVTNMYSMFHQCENLKELDLRNFNTSQVINMERMFEACKALKSIDLSSFDTSNVTTMNSMFSNCQSLKELDLRNFDTSQVTDMRAMFSSCRGFQELDFSIFDTFDTSNVTDFSQMFSSCENLKKLNIRSFKTNSALKMGNMFMNCIWLQELDLSSFDTSNVTDMYSMFMFCMRLEKLDLSNFNTSNVTNMRQMFHTCSSLSELNISHFDMRKAGSVGIGSGSTVNGNLPMLYMCNKLKTIVLPDNLESLKLLSEVLPENIDYYDVNLEKFVANDSTTNRPQFEDDNIGHTIIIHKSHDYVFSKIIELPDCTKNGLDEYVCTICGEIKKVTTEKLGHSYSSDWKCSSEGHYHECTVCSQKDNIIKHEYDNGTIISYPDCKHSGEKKYLCTICGYSKIEVIKSSGHKFSEWYERKEPTCTEDGIKGHYDCLICGKKFDASFREMDDIVIPKTGHSYSDEWHYSIDGHFHVCTKCSQWDSIIKHEYDDGTIVVAPDCEHSGKKQYTCEICNYIKNESVKSLGHEFSEWHERKEATCTEAGVKGHYECLTCHKFFNEKYEEIKEIVIDKLNHHFVYYPGILSTCSTEGRIGYYKCTMCGKMFNDEMEEVSETVIPKKEHELSEEWETNSNEHYHKCKICGKIVDKEAHEFGEWIEDGDKATRECSKCHYQETKTIEPIPIEEPKCKWCWLWSLLILFILITTVSYIICRDRENQRQNKKQQDAL